MQMHMHYVQELSRTLRHMPWPTVEQIIEVLHEARMSGRQVLIMGNGGSAATAAHMACDFGKSTAIPSFPRLRAISLADNMALFSAHANDASYEDVFAEQLTNLVQPRDVVIAVSASGRSPNVLKAVRVARSLGALTIGWSGHDGGELARLVHIPLVVPSSCTEQIEDIHLVLEHIITIGLRDAGLRAVSKTNGRRVISAVSRESTLLAARAPGLNSFGGHR